MMCVFKEHVSSQKTSFIKELMLVHLAEKTVPSHSTTSGTTNTGQIKRITACRNNTINTGKAATTETETTIPNTGTTNFGIAVVWLILDEDWKD